MAATAGTTAEAVANLPLDFHISWQMWDDEAGPLLKNTAPARNAISVNLDEIGEQLFNASAVLYGQKGFYSAQGISLRLANLEMDADVLF